MAKRFIDTNIFSDEWFSELSKDGKLFFVFYITNCDHAGILRLNKKLCEFQTGIKNIDTVRQELGNCLITVKEHLLFMPKYLKYQYPKFPQSNVKQQESAIIILKDLNLWDEKINSYITVRQELNNSYDNVNVIDNVNVKEVLNYNSINKVVLSTYLEFINMRAKIKHPIKTQLAIDKQAELLNKYDVDTQIKMINNSIANEYQGIFELKSNDIPKIKKEYFSNGNEIIRDKNGVILNKKDANVY